MMIFEPNLNCAEEASSPLTHMSLRRGASATPMLIKTEERYKHLHNEVFFMQILRKAFPEIEVSSQSEE